MPPEHPWGWWLTLVGPTLAAVLIVAVLVAYWSLRGARARCCHVCGRFKPYPIHQRRIRRWRALGGYQTQLVHLCGDCAASHPETP